MDDRPAEPIEIPGRDQVQAKPPGRSPVRVREGLGLVVAQARQRVRRGRRVVGDRGEDREDQVPQGRRAFERCLRVARVPTRLPNEVVGFGRPDNADPKRPRNEVLVAGEGLDVRLAPGGPDWVFAKSRARLPPTIGSLSTAICSTIKTYFTG